MAVSMPKYWDNNVAVQASLTPATNPQPRHGAVDSRPFPGHLNMRRAQPYATTNAAQSSTTLNQPYLANFNSSSYSVAANFNNAKPGHRQAPKQHIAHMSTKPLSHKRSSEQHQGVPKDSVPSARVPPPRSTPQPVSVNLGNAHLQMSPTKSSMLRMDHNKQQRRSQERHNGASQPGAGTAQRNRRPSAHIRPNSYVDPTSHSRHSQQRRFEPPKRQPTGHIPRDSRTQSWPAATQDGLGIPKSASAPNQGNRKEFTSSHFLLKDHIAHMRSNGRVEKSSNKNRDHRRSMVTVTVQPKDEQGNYTTKRVESDKRRASMPIPPSTQATPTPSAATSAATLDLGDDKQLPSLPDEPPPVASSTATKRNSLQMFLGRFGSGTSDVGTQGSESSSENGSSSAPAQQATPGDQPAPVQRRRMARPLSAVFLSNPIEDQNSEKPDGAQGKGEDGRSRFRWRLPVREAQNSQTDKVGEIESASQSNTSVEETRPLPEPPNSALIPSAPSSKSVAARRLGRSMHQRARSLVGTFKPRLAKSKQPSNESLTSDSSLDSDETPETPSTGASRPSKSGGTTHVVAFSSDIIYYDTWDSEEYDRTSGAITCTQLTPLLVEQIKEELNEFKMEMTVHKASKLNTHYYMD